MSQDELTKDEPIFKPPAKIIVVDDSPLNRNFITSAFALPNYEVIAAADGKEGIELIKKEMPELILLDIMMPNMDGFEVAEELKKDPQIKDIPIIFITALDAIKDKLKAFEAGAVDFVTKPFNHKELMARVKTNVQLRRLTIQKENMLRIAMEEKRNSAIARIAAGVSHNFNNMLGVSFGNIMLIESMLGDKLEPIIQDALKDVEKSLQRMQAMVKQFLVLANRSSESRGGMPIPSKIQLKTVLNDVISNIKMQRAGTNAQICCECDVDDSVEILFDDSHIREILQLILNEIAETTACKAKCRISAEYAPDGKPEAICRIEANGVPHVKEAADSIFEPFALPIANVGSGLSFSVAKHLLEVNGGKIEAKFPGQETLTFVLHLKTPAQK